MNDTDSFVQLMSGKTYRDTTNGYTVVLKWINVHDNGKIWAIVHPEGEPDMQSCYGMPLDELAYK